MKKLFLFIVINVISIIGIAQWSPSECINLVIYDDPEFTNMTRICWALDFDDSCEFTSITNVESWVSSFSETTVTNGSQYFHCIYPNINEEVYTCVYLYGTDTVSGDVIWTHEICETAIWDSQDSTWVIENENDDILSIDEVIDNSSINDDKCYDMMGREIPDLTFYPINTVYIKNRKKYVKI